MEALRPLLLAVIAAAMLVTSAPARPQRKASGAPTRPRASGAARRVDFQNFTYESGDEFIRVVRGRGTYRTSGGAASSYAVERVTAARGDLTGDGLEEAAVVLYFTGGGTGAFSKGFLFAVERGRPTLLATFEGGDRADGGIRHVSIKGGVLSVERNEPERMGDLPVGLCCPLYLITTRYRWDGRRLVQSAEPEKVEAGGDS